MVEDNGLRLVAAAQDGKCYCLSDSAGMSARAAGFNGLLGEFSNLDLIPCVVYSAPKINGSQLVPTNSVKLWFNPDT